MKMQNAEPSPRDIARRAIIGMRSGRKQTQNPAVGLLPSALRTPHSALRTSAFTLVEILASLLFLAIAVPAIVGALGIASRTSEVAERGSIAGGLAQNKLNEMLVDNAWQSAAQSNGDFGADYPLYHWQMSNQTWAGGTSTTGTTTTTASSSLTELSVEVFYPVQGNERSLRLTTLVNPSTTTSTTTTTTTTGTSTTR